MSNTADTAVQEPTAPTPVTEPEAIPAEETIEDVDALELAEAEAALAAEEAGQSTEAEATDDKTADAAGTVEPNADAAAPAADAAAGAPMIPKGRLDEALARGDKEQLSATYWRGVAKGLENQRETADAAAAPGAEPAPIGKSPQEQIAEIRAEKLGLADKFDNGELTFREVEAQRQGLDDQEITLQQGLLQPAATPAPAQPAAPTSDLYLEEVTDQIAAEHPYVNMIGEPGDNQLAAHRWANLEREAGLELIEQGTVFHPRADGSLPPRELLILREHVAELTDRYGPLWFPDAKFPDPAAAPSTPAAGAPAGEAPPLTPRQKARFDKLELAAGQPPDSTGVGGTGTTREYSEADITAMSEEELEALPDSIKRKFDPEYSS